MTKESLDSDRVNYMIWSYLIDSGYRETAARLQQEWNKPHPEQLTCAPHVPDHALVVLLNRGLLYSVVDREDAPVNSNDGEAVTGFFGPLTPAATTAEAADEDDFENARKRQIDNEQPQISNGPSSKRQRLSNGYENGFETTPMDLDDDANADENAYPSPEQLPSPVVATDGPEKGTQIDKVCELSTETVFLELSDDQASRNAVLLQCEWNPRDPTILAAAGTDALARMWTVRGTGAEADPNAQFSPVLQPYLNLLPQDAPSTTTGTALTWSSDGSSLAVASEPIDDSASKIEFWTKNGDCYAAFNFFESPIICLRWNLSNSACLSLSPEKGGTLISIMYPAQDQAIQYSLPQHSLHDQALEATWTSDEAFVLCGGDILQGFQCVEGTISPIRKYETREGHALSKITFDWQSGLLATASDTGTIDIWDQLGQCQSFNAHQGVITSLIWQPLPFPHALPENMGRFLASAGEDGAICVWNARMPDSKSKCSMTMSSAVVSLAFSPDGAFIAGATADRILIWKVDEASLPRASWIRSDQAGWRTPMSQDSNTDENSYSLSWDANGQKLAYGVNTSLAVITFRR
ncbi:WD40-repeat-containing domain protein [Tricladium varicosporioides]|nr:WD40-repeat-containing domain protein [Hymenoscyphus varicosporioides]